MSLPPRQSGNNTFKSLKSNISILDQKILLLVLLVLTVKRRDKETMTVIPIYNPYAASRKRTMNGTSAVPPSGTKKNQSHTSNSAFPLFTTMGIQSQNLEASIKKCCKTATKGKYK